MDGGVWCIVDVGRVSKEYGRGVYSMVNVDAMKRNKDLKGEAWTMLTGNWGMAIAVTLVMYIILSAASSVAGIGSLIIGGAIEWGLVYWFIRFSKEGETPEFGEVFHGFNYFGESLAAFLLRMLYVVLWALLCIIPGIVFAIAYSQTFFILNDNPDMSATNAIRLSREMMKGAKAKYFGLMLSFIGWFLLTMISFGIAGLWMVPYVWTTQAKFYEDLKANYQQ
jgi:uncharacterized membrane protein